MIVFNLICKICSVEFEGWFESTKEFNNQKRKKIINCPSCNSASIIKSLAAPNLPTKNNSKKNIQLKMPSQIILKNTKKLLKRILTMLEINLLKKQKK